MRIVSFSYTVAPLLAGAKTATWRDWDTDYANTFKKGDFIAAFDRSPRFSGKKVAELVLTHDPEFMSSADAPDKFWIEEGMQWIYQHPDFVPKTLWNRPCGRGDFSWLAYQQWRAKSVLGYVVRFKIARLMPGVRTAWGCSYQNGLSDT